MSPIFEWDPFKDRENQRKHGVSFIEAASAFRDALSRTIHDPEHSDREDRFVLLGLSAQGQILVVVHSERGENIRIIRARRAVRLEEHLYFRQH